MDYKLAAPKLLCAQLKEATETTSHKVLSLTIGSLLFQRAWLQGILVSVSDDGNLVLDDGTGVIALCLPAEFRNRPWQIGMYVMVVGGYFIRMGEAPMIKVHKIVDLSPFPDREAMWYLEVLEAYKLFYKPLLEG